jgi:hypothetical protein
MKNNLLKLNESSLGIMKRVRKHESKLLSINLPCSINTALERGTPWQFYPKKKTNCEWLGWIIYPVEIGPIKVNKHEM